MKQNKKRQSQPTIVTTTTKETESSPMSPNVVFTFRPEKSLGRKPWSVRKEREKQERLNHLRQQIESERIASDAQKDFLCRRAIFYTLKAITSTCLTLIYGLYVMEGPKLPCSDLQEHRLTGHHLHTLLQVAFLTSLASILLDASLIPYFDVYGNVRGGQREKEAWWHQLAWLVHYLDFTVMGAQLFFAFILLSLMNGNAACFRQDEKLTSFGSLLLGLTWFQIGEVTTFTFIKLLMSPLAEMTKYRQMQADQEKLDDEALAIKRSLDFSPWKRRDLTPQNLATARFEAKKKNQRGERQPLLNIITV